MAAPSYHGVAEFEKITMKCVWPGGISWWPMVATILTAPWQVMAEISAKPFRNFGFQNKTLIPSGQLWSPFTLCTSLSLISASPPSGASVTANAWFQQRDCRQWPPTSGGGLPWRQPQPSSKVSSSVSFFFFCSIFFFFLLLLSFSFSFNLSYFLLPLFGSVSAFLFSFFLFCSILFFSLFCFSLFSVPF